MQFNMKATILFFMMPSLLFSCNLATIFGEVSDRKFEDDKAYILIENTGENEFSESIIFMGKPIPVATPIPVGTPITTPNRACVAILNPIAKPIPDNFIATPCANSLLAPILIPKKPPFFINRNDKQKKIIRKAHGILSKLNQYWLGEANFKVFFHDEFIPSNELPKFFFEDSISRNNTIALKHCTSPEGTPCYYLILNNTDQITEDNLRILIQKEFFKLLKKNKFKNFTDKIISETPSLQKNFIKYNEELEKEFVIYSDYHLFNISAFELKPPHMNSEGTLLEFCVSEDNDLSKYLTKNRFKNFELNVLEKLYKVSTVYLNPYRKECKESITK